MLHNKDNKKIDIIISIAIVAVFAMCVAFFFGYFYSSNDDVFIKDMLSGAYTGRPEALNIQMLSPISAFLALLYRLMPSIPVYGLFLCMCQYIATWLIIIRLMKYFEGVKGKILFSVIIIMLVTGLAIQYYSLVQYTVTVAFLVTGAIAYYVTIPSDLSTVEHLKTAVPFIVTLVLAFMIRSEMLLLCLPFVGASVLMQYLSENNRWTWMTIKKHFYVGIVIVLAGISVFVIDKICYSGNDWDLFIHEFNARTKLYDYQYIPDYEMNKDFYSSVSLTKADVELLENYDYGLDDRIDADVLNAVAAYADGLREETGIERMWNALKEYLFRTIRIKDGMYSYVPIILYLAVIISGRVSAGNKLVNAPGLFALLAARSISWLFILYGGRTPDRIIHPLYFMEVLILVIYLCMHTSKTGRKTLIMILLMGLSFIMAGRSIYIERIQIKEQKEANIYGTEIDKYCKTKKSNFYFEDVHTTIVKNRSIGEPMFESVDNSLKNYDLIGGWAVNSPLYMRKLEHYGIKDVDDDIINKDNVFIICKKNREMWIEDYYADRDIDVEILCEDNIVDDICVYKVKTSDYLH